MRGGTANCSVIISDEKIGSPVVTVPEILVAMNLPSIDKFEKAVKKGGTVYIDSSLATRQVERSDITVVYIPAAKLASENDLHMIGNMILLGNMLADTDEKIIKEALQHAVAEKRGDMIENNFKAFLIGKNYK
jgi:2-oxoglutarate ferredoxin oxidoreductase subunit gamma